MKPRVVLGRFAFCRLNAEQKNQSPGEIIMKKSLFLIYLIVFSVIYSSASYADRGGRYDRGGYGRHPGPMYKHGYRYVPRPQIIYYAPPPQVHYYPAPQVHYYPPQPPVHYYPQQARYTGDQRSHQGLAGGVVGSVFGYELGNGDPLATGLGAAAGSLLGNGMGGGYSNRR